MAKDTKVRRADREDEKGAHPGAVPGRARARSGDEALFDRADGDVRAHLIPHDGERTDPPGRSGDAGLCLCHTDFRAHSSVRPGAGENRGCDQKDRSIQPALYCDLWGEVTLFDLDKYLADLILNCQSAFGERLLYMGLQGSWLRGEAHENSDIDIMVILDGFSVRDMDIYRGILKEIGFYEKSCGFICGKDEMKC